MERETKKAAGNYYDEKVQSFFDIWGGENIHFGIFDEEGQSVAEASMKTIAYLYALLNNSAAKLTVLDLGSGFGGAARHLAGLGHEVTGIDVSPENNKVHRQLNRERGLDSITVMEGRFEDLPFEDGTFDVIWSQEAICHSKDMESVLGEAFRVMRPGGQFVLGNTCCSETTPPALLAELNERNSLDLRTIQFHSDLAESLGMRIEVRRDMSRYLSPHYRTMLSEVREKQTMFEASYGKRFFDRVVDSLLYWRRVSEDGHLAWGVWKFTK